MTRSCLWLKSSMPLEDEAAELELLSLEAVDPATQVALVEFEDSVCRHRLDLRLPGAQPLQPDLEGADVIAPTVLHVERFEGVGRGLQHVGDIRRVGLGKDILRHDGAGPVAWDVAPGDALQGKARARVQPVAAPLEESPIDLDLFGRRQAGSGEVLQRSNRNDPSAFPRRPVVLVILQPDLDAGEVERADVIVLVGAQGSEIAYKRDPTRNAVHIIDHTKEFRTLVGSRFASDVTPPYCAFS